MLKKTIKQTSIAFATTITLAVASIGLSAPAQAAGIHLKPVHSSEITAPDNLIQVRSLNSKRSHSFKKNLRKTHKHRNFKRGRSYKSGHRNDFTKRQIPGFVLTPKSR